jgi:hypothetical protein
MLELNIFRGRGARIPQWRAHARGCFSDVHVGMSAAACKFCSGFAGCRARQAQGKLHTALPSLGCKL